MDYETFIEKLNEISWIEHVNFELSEKYPESVEDEAERFQQMLIELGSQIKPNLLDTLETDEEGIVWALRLSPYVSDDDSKARAKKHLNHESKQVTYWVKFVITQMQ